MGLTEGNFIFFFFAFATVKKPVTAKNLVAAQNLVQQQY